MGRGRKGSQSCEEWQVIGHWSLVIRLMAAVEKWRI